MSNANPTDIHNGARKVKAELMKTSFITRWPCHVCGGHTEKVAILTEVPAGEYGGLRVCETCIEAQAIDAGLRRRAAELEGQAEAIRNLIGLLEVPTPQEYHAAELQDEIETLRFRCEMNEKEVGESLIYRLANATNPNQRRAIMAWLQKEGHSELDIQRGIAVQKRRREAALLRQEQETDPPF